MYKSTLEKFIENSQIHNFVKKNKQHECDPNVMFHISKNPKIGWLQNNNFYTFASLLSPIGALIISIPDFYEPSQDLLGSVL